MLTHQNYNNFQIQYTEVVILEDTIWLYQFDTYSLSKLT